MQEVHSSNPPVVTEICDPSKSRVRHHRSLKLDSKLKYLNDSKGSYLTTSAKMVVCFVMFCFVMLLPDLFSSVLSQLIIALEHHKILVSFVSVA